MSYIPTSLNQVENIRYSIKYIYLVYPPPTSITAGIQLGMLEIACLIISVNKLSLVQHRKILFSTDAFSSDIPFHSFFILIGAVAWPEKRSFELPNNSCKLEPCGMEPHLAFK